MQNLHTPEKFTAQDLAAWGTNDVAYVKTVYSDDGEPTYTIHAADGTQMATMADRETAFAAVRQNELEPMSVH
jgi:hypothetical protein